MTKKITDMNNDEPFEKLTELTKIYKKAINDGYYLEAIVGQVLWLRCIVGILCYGKINEPAKNFQDYYKGLEHISDKDMFRWASNILVISKKTESNMISFCNKRNEMVHRLVFGDDKKKDLKELATEEFIKVHEMLRNDAEKLIDKPIE